MTGQLNVLELQQTEYSIKTTTKEERAQYTVAFLQCFLFEIIKTSKGRQMLQL